MTATTNEVAFNTVFAEALRSKNPRWKNQVSAEQSNMLAGAKGQRPDIVVDMPGMVPVVLETEFEPAGTVEQDAQARIGERLSSSEKMIENVIALRIPNNLRTTVQGDLRSTIEEVEYECALISASSNGTARWPEAGWLNHRLDDIVRSIETVALSEQLIERGMDEFRAGVESCTHLLEEAAAQGFADPINILAETLHQEPGRQTTRMGMAILANAFNFHNAIAGSHDIKPPDQLFDKEMLLAEWERILHDVNYWPIFSIAMDILKPVRVDTSLAIMKRLRHMSAKLVNVGISTMHDLSGRMLQQLITDRKFLATFYTLPSSAALLAELSVSRMEQDWGNPLTYQQVRVADLSCGTGTLISAAYHAVQSQCRRSSLDDAKFHRPMIEDSLIAADIMPVATHLAASQLSSAHPAITFGKCKIFTMAYGRVYEESGFDTFAIGSLDLLGSGYTPTLFATGESQLSGSQQQEELHNATIRDGSVDLIIMNPPFTRPTNHESTNVPIPSFAGFQNSIAEQKHMGEKLSRYINAIRARSSNPSDRISASHGNAGLASNFFDLAHTKICESGILALVLPFSFASGESWKGARELLQRFYSDILIVSIATTGSTERAFSADTGMAEVLVVAKRRSGDFEHSKVLYVNLLSRPSTLLEAIETARLVGTIDVSRSTFNSGRIEIGNAKHGTYVCASLSEGGCAGLRESTLASSMIQLKNGQLSLPQLGKCVSIPITRLRSIGNRGLVDRDIAKRGDDDQQRSAFSIHSLFPDSEPTISGLWMHDADKERQFFVQPDVELVRRDECDKGKFSKVISTASRLHLNRDFQINSQSLAACLTRRPVLGGRAWPNFTCNELEWEQIIVMWVNSTLGVMTFWWHGTRQQMGRSISTISKLPELHVIDPRCLTSAQLEVCNRVFQQLEDSEFLPANEAWRDDTRKELDRALLVDVLGYPDDILDPLDSLRLQWCNEPSVHGGKDTRPKH